MRRRSFPDLQQVTKLSIPIKETVHEEVKPFVQTADDSTESTPTGSVTSSEPLLTSEKEASQWRVKRSWIKYGLFGILIVVLFVLFLLVLFNTNIDSREHSVTDMKVCFMETLKQYVHQREA